MLRCLCVYFSILFFNYKRLLSKVQFFNKSIKREVDSTHYTKISMASIVRKFNEREFRLRLLNIAYDKHKSLRDTYVHSGIQLDTKHVYSFKSALSY